MKNGYIKLFRDIRQHHFWQQQPFSRGQAWIDLLLRANFTDAKVLFGNKFIDMKRGQFITSVLKLSEDWGWSMTKVDTFLNLLKTDGMITFEKDNKKTVITICKYDYYQSGEATEKKQKENKKETNEKQKETDKKEEEEIKKEKKVVVGTPPPPPTLAEVEAYFAEKGYRQDVAAKAWQYYTAAHWQDAKGRAVKNWKQKMIASWFKDDHKITADNTSPLSTTPSLSGRAGEGSNYATRRLRDERKLRELGEDTN